MSSALGVLLLEILSGRRNSSFYHDEEFLSLLGFVSHLSLIAFFFYIPSMLVSYKFQY